MHCLTSMQMREVGIKEFAEYGSPMKIAKVFGGKEGYQQAVLELENEIFSA